MWLVVRPWGAERQVPYCSLILILFQSTLDQRAFIKVSALNLYPRGMKYADCVMQAVLLGPFPLGPLLQIEVQSATMQTGQTAIRAVSLDIQQRLLLLSMMRFQCASVYYE